MPELLSLLLPLLFAVFFDSVSLLAELREADCSSADEVTDKPEFDRQLLGNLLWEL